MWSGGKPLVVRETEDMNSDNKTAKKKRKTFREINQMDKFMAFLSLTIN